LEGGGRVWEGGGANEREGGGEERVCCRTLDGLYLLEFPAIRHGRHHLGELLLLALEHSVNMLHWGLEAGKEGRGTQMMV